MRIFSLNPVLVSVIATVLYKLVLDHEGNAPVKGQKLFGSNEWQQLFSQEGENSEYCYQQSQAWHLLALARGKKLSLTND